MKRPKSTRVLLSTTILVSAIVGASAPVQVVAAPILTYQGPWTVTITGGTPRGAFGRNSVGDKQVTGTGSAVAVLKSESRVSGTMSSSASNRVVSKRTFSIEGCEQPRCKVTVNGTVFGGGKPGLEGELVLGNPFFAPSANVSAAAFIFKSPGTPPFDLPKQSLTFSDTFSALDDVIVDSDALSKLGLPLPGETTTRSIMELKSLQGSVLLPNGLYIVENILSTEASIRGLDSKIFIPNHEFFGMTLGELYKTYLTEFLPMPLTPEAADTFINGSSGLAQSNFFDSFEVSLTVTAPEPPDLALLALGLAGIGLARRQKRRS